MRRGLASFVLGLSLFIASLSWGGFTLSRTVLDPGTSERLADQLLNDNAVRSALTTRLADSLEEQLPDQVPVPRSEVEDAAQAALDDPLVESVVRDGFVRSHQNALAGNDEPVRVETSAIGDAGREALVEANPLLDSLLPQTPSIGFELPTTGLAWIGSVKSFVDRYTIIGAFLAAIGALGALLIARKRAMVLRRVAYWAFGASAFWLIVAYAVPLLLGMISPTSSAFASALVRIFFAEMIPPALIIAGFGVVMLIASMLWPIFDRRRGAQKLQPRQSSVSARQPRPVESPIKPSSRATAGHVPQRATEPAATPGTNPGWLAKEQQSTSHNTATTHDYERGSGGNVKPPVEVTSMAKADQVSMVGRHEQTAVMPTPDSGLSTELDGESVVHRGSELGPAPGDPVQQWVEGQGYADDSQPSPYADPSSPNDEIDLSDRS